MKIESPHQIDMHDGANRTETAWNAEPFYCTAFEELMYAQDSLSYPCTIVVKMLAYGDLNREAFENSVVELLHRHPLLSATLGLHRGRRVWLFHRPTKQVISWCDCDDTEAWSDDSFIPIDHAVGFRIRVRQSAVAISILVECHHAASDALGLFGALEEMWQLYNAQVLGLPMPAPMRDRAVLRRRNRFGVSWRVLPRMVRQQLIGLMGVRQFLMRRPIPLADNEPFLGARVKPLPVDAVTVRLDSSCMSNLLEIARNQKATLNDVIAACIFRGCAGFRTKTNLKLHDCWFRMMVPVNMRTNEDHHQTACNIVSSVFLDRTPNQASNFRTLLISIRDEMNLIKRNRLALMLIFSLWVVRKFTRRIKNQTQRSCKTTMVFTNLGRVFHGSTLLNVDSFLEAGQLVIAKIDTLAPITAFTNASFSLSSYANELSLCLRYDPRETTRTEADDLINRIANEVTEFAAVFGTPPRKTNVSKGIEAQ